MTTDLENELMAAKRRIEDLQIQLNLAEELVDVYKHRVERAYTERSYATAALARMALRAGLEAGTGLDDTPGMDEFSTILYVDTPAGQVSWHYKDDDLWLLDGLPRYEKPWDGTSRSKDGSFSVWDQKSNDDDELTNKAFKFGYTLACCTLVHMHDQPGMAKDVLKDIGLTRADTKAMNLTDFDAKLLRKIERSPGHGELYIKKKRKT
jgi:hypothetical protein